MKVTMVMVDVDLSLCSLLRGHNSALQAGEVNGFPNHASWYEDLDPLMHIMAELSSEKMSLQRIQNRVLL